MQVREVIAELNKLPPGAQLFVTNAINNDTTRENLGVLSTDRPDIFVLDGGEPVESRETFCINLDTGARTD